MESYCYDSSIGEKVENGRVIVKIRKGEESIGKLGTVCG